MKTELKQCQLQNGVKDTKVVHKSVSKHQKTSSMRFHVMFLEDSSCTHSSVSREDEAIILINDFKELAGKPCKASLRTVKRLRETANMTRRSRAGLGSSQRSVQFKSRLVELT